MKTQAKAETIKRMQKCLDRLGVPLNVVWLPKLDAKVHGKIEVNSRTLFLYDSNQDDVWDTFLHECLEWKVKGFVKVYREVINGLIEIIEKTCYKKKEEFFDFLPRVFRTVEEERRKNAPSR